MPIQTIESQRLYRQIAEQLGALIASGEFSKGQRLPSERELSTLLGVSRQSVREALIALEIAGKVEVRVGAGIYVAAPRGAAAEEPAREEPDPFELLRARWLVEGEVAAVAAREALPADLETIRAAVDELQRVARQERSTEAPDRAFHLGVAASTHNGALLSVVRDLWDRGKGAIWKRMENHFQTPDLRAATLRDHRAILGKLEAKDERGARAAMRQHLDRVEREFDRGWEQLKAHETAKQPETLRLRQPPGARSSRLRSPR